MTRLQLNTNEMGTSVSQTLATNELLFAGMPIVVASVAEHNEHIVTIAELAAAQQRSKQISGLIHDKNMLRGLIIINVTRIINGITAYAKAVSNDELAKSVHYTDSYLKAKSDAKVLAAFTTVLGVANANSAAILPYGVSAGMLTLLTQDSASFSEIVQKPKSMRSVQKLITENLQKAVRAMVVHLEDSLDKLIRANFLGSDFANTYFLSRRVYKTGGSKTAIVGHVTDANGHPVKKAMVELLNYPTPGVNTTRFTNDAGYFAFKQLDLTTGTLRCRALNFEDKQTTKQVEKDKENKVDFSLVPAAAPVPVLV